MPFRIPLQYRLRMAAVYPEPRLIGLGDGEDGYLSIGFHAAVLRRFSELPVRQRSDRASTIRTLSPHLGMVRHGCCHH